MPELVEDHIGYHRLTVIGGDLSIPFGNFVFRGEIADNIDDGGHHQGNALAALDWYPGADWNVSVQYNQTFGAGEHSKLATLRVSKALLLETNTVTPLLQRMEKEGVLTRRKGEQDARQMIVSLTRKGKELQKKLAAVPAAVGEAVLCESVTAETAPELFRMLDDIIAKLSCVSE